MDMHSKESLRGRYERGDLRVWGIDYSLFASLMLFFLMLFSGTILVGHISHAESTTASASVNVVSACSLTATNTTPHTASIPPGTYRADIGNTTLKAVCNDAGGFAIYAIGYTDAELGKTTLTANINNQLIPADDISTGTATSGSISNWAMKLTTNSSATYPATLDSGYGSYNVVPSSYTKVASRASGTDAGVVATGAEVNAMYAAFISSGQEAGTYNGKVKYTMVHPFNESPAQEYITEAGCIRYYPNSSLAIGSMGCQPINTSDTSATLLAGNYSREGYGFVGWSDRFDYNDNPNAHFYGPQSDISFVAGQYTGNNGGLSLYAVWVPSAGSLQDSTKVSELCGNGQNSLIQAPTDGTAGLSSVSALTDLRDNQTYAIAKLSDGKCWMIENLRINASSTRGDANRSLAQGYGSTTNYGRFIGLADSEAPWELSSINSNSTYSTNGASDTIAIGDTYAGYRFPRYNNTNTSSRAISPTSNDSAMYSYGNYYTWSAAIADTDDHFVADSNVDNTSICPLGWRLPRGGGKSNESVNDYWQLIVVGINGGVKPAEYDSTNTPSYRGDPEGVNISRAFRAFPNNFVQAGQVNTSFNNLGSGGLYWTSTDGGGGASAYRLNFGRSGIAPANSANNKSYGRSVRCLMVQGS